MEQNAYLNFLEKEAKKKKKKTSKGVFKEQQHKLRHETKQKQKNLYLQNIIEAYNPYNNLNASERAAMSYEKQRNNLTTIGTQGCFDIRA